MKSELGLNKTHLLFMAIAVIALIGLGVLALQSYTAAAEAMSTLTTKKDRLVQLKKELDETKQSIDTLKKEQAEFKGLLFDERDVPAFLDGISASAAKSSVYVMEMQSQQFSEVTVPKHVVDTNGKLKRMKASETDEAEVDPNSKEALEEMLTLASMPINFKIRGDYQAIVNFMNSIENYRQLLNVSNVEISSGSTNYPFLTCQFTLKIYSLKKLGDIRP